MMNPPPSGDCRDLIRPKEYTGPISITVQKTVFLAHSHQVLQECVIRQIGTASSLKGCSGSLGVAE
jgi:hypothetical protein